MLGCFFSTREIITANIALFGSRVEALLNPARLRACRLKAEDLNKVDNMAGLGVGVLLPIKCWFYFSNWNAR